MNNNIPKNDDTLPTAYPISVNITAYTNNTL